MLFALSLSGSFFEYLALHPLHSPLERRAEPAEVGWLTEGETGWNNTKHKFSEYAVCFLYK
jgi:hypothetical protein